MENNELQLKLTKGDLVSAFVRSNIFQASWNYERMQAVGYAYSMVPAINRLYPDKKDRAEAMQRHLEFFNTHPYLASPIIGVSLAMEEQRANGAEINDAAINGVKVGMMGPLAGVGDPIFWGTLRPVLAAFGANLAMSGSILGPLIFFFGWNIIRLAFRWYTQSFGYKAGTEIVKDMGGGLLQKLTHGASILGLFIMGVLVARWTVMKFPMVISSVDTKVQKGVSYYIQGATDKPLKTELVGKVQEMPKVTTLGNIFDQILPGIMPLLLTFCCMWLLKKGVNPIVIIFGLFVLGIAGYALGIFGV